MKLKEKSFFGSVTHVVLTSLAVALAVAMVAYASTTISTDISTDGNLTVTGTSGLTGVVTITGAVKAYSGLTVGTGTTVNTLDGTILFKAQTSDPTGVTEGTLYYNSTSKVLKLFDGTNWFTTGTTTSGISLSGARLQLADLATQYLALGTTTQQGLSMVTLEATSTAAIPLSLVARNSQTADILDVLSAGSAKLLYINASGGLFGSSTLQVTGAVTTYGATTLGDAAGDTVTLTGNASALGTLNVTGLTTLGFASTSALSLNGTTANLMVNGMATTTASTGDFGTMGKIGAGTTTPTTLELSAEGSATTTIGAFSTTALTGGCIQLEATDGNMYRMYLNATDVATTTSTGHQGIVAIWELGSCK
ncbi:MAG TPA: hypothetical protein VJH94_03255 [Candidatus Paceibacterota bacterium]